MKVQSTFFEIMKMSEIVVVVTKNVTVKNASVSLECYSQSADVTIKATIKSAIDRAVTQICFILAFSFFIIYCQSFCPKVQTFC